MLDPKCYTARSWPARACPKDCPFLGRLGSLPYCRFSEYALVMEDDRETRMTVDKNGNIDWHLPPNCDMYEKYKGTKLPRLTSSNYMTSDDLDILDKL